jgi:PDDEXK-like uncharacterized protein DUF3799
VTARLLTCTTAEYHLDLKNTPDAPIALHNSSAKRLIEKSPMHAHAIHPRLGAKGRDTTKAMDAGTLMHALILGQPMDSFVVLDVADYKTKDARALRDAAIADGMQPVKRADLEEAKVAAAQIVVRLAELETPILFTGESEVKIEWEENDHEGNITLCRGMIDHVILRPGGATIYDLKTIEGADEESCKRQIANYGYDIQGAAYTSALAKLYPHLQGRIEFVDVFVEIEPPYGVNPLSHGGPTRHRGEMLWAKACREWAIAMKTGKWRGYSTGTRTTDVPTWALMQTEELTP